MVSDARFDAIVSALVGTCGTLEQVATPDECADAGFLSALDLEAFCCDTCGWWYERGESCQHGYDVCGGCCDEEHGDL